MNGIKDVFKSKKFLAALIGSIIIFLQGTYLKDHPQLIELVIGVAGLFGIVIAGQAHADANDDKYGEKYKDDNK